MNAIGTHTHSMVNYSGTYVQRNELESYYFLYFPPKFHTKHLSFNITHQMSAESPSVK